MATFGVDSPIMPYLPNLVIHRIFRLATTKVAIYMSFLWKELEDMLKTLPILEFDEDDDQFDHEKLINIVQKYLEVCDKDKEATKITHLLEKLRLRMTRYSSEDANMVSKLLTCSFKRSVKDVDISLRGENNVTSYYYLCRTNFINAKSLTTLNLECVRMKNIYSGLHPVDYSISLRLLPSLRTMTLKDVQFDVDALAFLVWECPFIEHLSLISCKFESTEIRVVSTSLKSLEIKHCKSIAALLYVEQLESLTIVSSEYPDSLMHLFLRRCRKLKYMNIYAQCLRNFALEAGCPIVNDKGVIDVPSLDSIHFTGYLESKLSLKCPSLYGARIELLNNTITDDLWKHCSDLKDFLQELNICKDMIIHVHDFEVVMFPEDIRKTLMPASPILPYLEILDVSTRIGPTDEIAKQNWRSSMYWMAPALKKFEFDVFDHN